MPKIAKKIAKKATEKPGNIRLVDHGGDPSKRWYLDVSLLDSGTQKIVRKRVFKIFYPGQSVQQWRTIAQDYIDKFNRLLASGYHFTFKTRFDQIEEAEGHSDYGKMTLQQAFELFIASKSDREKPTLNRYRFTLTLLREFEAGHRPIPPN